VARPHGGSRSDRMPHTQPSEPARRSKAERRTSCTCGARLSVAIPGARIELGAQHSSLDRRGNLLAVSGSRVERGEHGEWSGALVDDGPERVSGTLRGFLRARRGNENKSNMLLVGGDGDPRSPALMMNTTTIYATACRSRHPAATAGASIGGGWPRRGCDRIAVG
jgi:hypothetical protein